MVASSAGVVTDRPRFFLQQLCEHFADSAHRHSGQEFGVSFEEDRGEIDFAPVIAGSLGLDAGEDVLILRAQGDDPAALERVQRIVGKHLKRFAEPDRLEVEWSAASERRSPG